jgi:PIN domain nuclease of toxin-antitoxin system
LRLLLDTHVLVFWFTDDQRLGKSARGSLSDRNNEILVSVVALWEIVMKQRVGKMQADLGRMLELVDDNGFNLLPMSPKHLFSLATLPMHHRDPFDHLLIAQAIAEDAILMSNDRYAAAYPVRVLTASR